MSIDLSGELPGLIYEKRDHIGIVTLSRPSAPRAVASERASGVRSEPAASRTAAW